MRFRALTSGSLAAMLATLALGSIVTSAQESASTTLTPTQARTVALSRCGAPTLSTADTNCRGFDSRDIRNDPSVFVVGFENNQELNEKHVLQVAATFDLSQVAIDQNSQVTHATLTYAEVSTTRRSAGGDSEYGILPSCNTRLGVPTTEWTGSTDALVATRPALTAGVTPATTGDAGSWDITPQLKAWVADGKQKATLVMDAEDQSPAIQGQTMCLSYVSDLTLQLEVGPKQ